MSTSNPVRGEAIPSVLLAVVMETGGVEIRALALNGRSPTLPEGAEWLGNPGGWWKRDPTAATIAAELVRSHPPGFAQPVTARLIQLQDVPDWSYRAYRRAWVDGGDRITFDMPRARDIHRDRLRLARLPAFAALDAAYQQADEQQDVAAKQAVAAQKQQLRDLPADPKIDRADTIADLLAAWPTEALVPVAETVTQIRQRMTQ